MRKLTTTAEQRRRIQKKRTARNVRSKEKAATWRRRLPLALAAEKRVRLEAEAVKKAQEETT